MRQRLEIEWQETANELKKRYKQEKHPQRRTRLQTLWHLRQGKRIQDVVGIVGMSYRTIQNWIAWYRQGGLAEVLLRITGHGSQGVAPFLNERQQRALAAKAELGAFRTVWDAVAWVEARWGIRYTYKGMYALLKRHGFGPKVPRPQSEKANLAQQEQWKKGGW